MITSGFRIIKDKKISYVSSISVLALEGALPLGSIRLDFFLDLDTFLLNMAAVDTGSDDFKIEWTKLLKTAIKIWVKDAKNCTQRVNNMRRAKRKAVSRPQSSRRSYDRTTDHTLILVRMVIAAFVSISRREKWVFLSNSPHQLTWSKKWPIN